MKLMDQTIAIMRLIFRGSEEGTISGEAQRAAEAAATLRQEKDRQLNELLCKLVRQRIEKRIAPSESTNRAHL